MQLQIRKLHLAPSALLGRLAMLAILPLALSQSAAAVSPELKPEEEARNTKSELSAGGVHALVEVAEPGLTFSVGGSAFVTLRLANRSKAKSLAAELHLESDLAELAGVTGKSVKSVKSDTGMRASIKGLRKGKPRKVLIEVKLRAGDEASGYEGKSINRLKIALKQAGAKDDAAMDQTVVVWPAADCAADFFNGITAIRDRNSKAISTALKAARTRDKKRPGRWLFQPGVSKDRQEARLRPLGQELEAVSGKIRTDMHAIQDCKKNDLDSFRSAQIRGRDLSFCRPVRLVARHRPAVVGETE